MFHSPSRPQGNNWPMAWEWVGTSIVGGLGIYYAWKTGKQSRDQAIETLREQLGHDRLLAREAREQDRLATAYVALMKMTEQTGQWAQMVYPVVQTGELPATPLPSLELQADTAALVSAYGSPAVRHFTEEWESVVRQMIIQAELVQWEDENPAQPGDPRWARPYANSPRGMVDSLRPEERKRREALAAQVRAELANLYRSSQNPSGFTRSYRFDSARKLEIPLTGQQEDSGQLPS